MPFSFHLGTISIPDIALIAPVFLAYAGMNRRLSVVGDGGLRRQGAAKTVVPICVVFIPRRFYFG
ncbi:hypothetical protein CBF45_12825 [Bordetella sp. J329]|nr:hypothetical protein CBF45_12825 [Bordetella sp. J329]